MLINRCVCANRTFASLVDQARQDGLTLTQLTDQTCASRGCGMCAPYLRRALRTGQTEFDQLVYDADEPAEENAA